MIQLTAQMRILVAVEPADFRCGIDGLSRLCRQVLSSDPFSGAVFVFRNRRATAIKILAYDGQGFWLCQKRMSQSRFCHWPQSASGEAGKQLLAHELSVLLAGGNPSASQAAPQWRRVTPPVAA
jgi:transposase